MSNELESFLTKLKSKKEVKNRVATVYYKKRPSQVFFFVNNYLDEKTFPQVAGVVSSGVENYNSKNKGNLDLRILPDDPEIKEDVKRHGEVQEVTQRTL